MASIKAMAKMPSMMPPTDVIPDFVNPYSLEEWVILCAALSLSMTTVFVAIRMYVKHMVTRSLDWADYTCCLAWLGLIIDCLLGLIALHYGLGVHQWNVPLTHFFKFLKYLYVMEVIFGPVIFFTELSLLLLYIKIFVVNYRSATYILIQLVLWLNAFFYMAMTLSVIFMCSPVAKFWNPLQPGRCLNSFAIIVTSAAFNVASNITTVFLPVRAIWRLQMPLKRKIGVSAVFMTGLFACLASIMRLYLSIRKGHSKDETYNMTAIMLWTVAEISTGIICGCLPYMPQFIHHFAAKLSAIASRTRIGKHFGSSGNSSRPSTLPTHERKPVPNCQISTDLTSFDGAYLELKTSSERGSALGHSNGMTTTIQGGVEPPRHSYASRGAVPNTSIVKTSRLEQHP